MYKLILLALLFLVIGCEPDMASDARFVVLPTPSEMEVSGNSEIAPGNITSFFCEQEISFPTGKQYFTRVNAENDADFLITIDADLNLREEGYRLVIKDKKIVISAKDRNGALYGMMTLRQLIEDASDQAVSLPIVNIVDEPSLAYRAIHIDVKHHREKKEYYYALIDRLVKFKINGIIVEIEDKLSYVQQPIVGSSDAFSIEEWKDLSNYALERGIEISPLVQGLGHASFILKHDAYKNLRDHPESDWAFNPLDPKTYEVQFDLYEDALKAFPHGKYLHIGGDEVHTTGRESGRSALELQLIWLEKVCVFAAANNRTPIFWDDMPLKHAGVYRPMFDTDIAEEKVDSIWTANEHNLVEFIDRFPENCIYMRWNYQTPGTYGNLKAMDWFSSNGFQVMGATAGQTRWSLMPQNQSNIPSIRTFALASIEKDLDGLLLTLWDDDSPHFELYIRGIMAFAEFTWSGDRKSIAELKGAYRQRAFGPELYDNDYAFIDMLEGPVGFWKNALLQEGTSRNNLRRFEEPLQQATIELPVLDSKGEWSNKFEDRLEESKAHVATLDSIDTIISNAKSANSRNDYTLRMYEQVAKLVRFSLESLIELEALDISSVDNQEEALKRVQTLSERFSQMRGELEEVYGETRLLNKPEGYILDQDHHTHNANQTLNFDWQFYPEMLLLEKIQKIE